MALPGRGGKIGSERRAVSASRDQTLKVWDLEAGTVITTFSRSPDRWGDDSRRVHSSRSNLSDDN